MERRERGEREREEREEDMRWQSSKNFDPFL
jgi:hypothetical protein